MDVDTPDNAQTISQRQSGSSQVIHVRQDSASELEALFNTVMNPNFKSKSLPMKARNLPKSFFQQPDRPRPSGHYHHGHSQSMGGLSATSPSLINHSRSSSSDSNTSHTSPAGLNHNTNSNNIAGLSGSGLSPGNPMNGNMKSKLGYSMSPAQRRAVAHNQLANARNHGANLQVPQVAHNRSKSSPASLQLLDLANHPVKVSDIPHDMPLPPGWSLTKTPDGQQYFMNHNDRSTTWEDPRIAILEQQRQNQVVPIQSQTMPSPAGLAQQALRNNNNAPTELSIESLPPGWEQANTPQGEIYYINHQARSTSWVHPRIQNMQQNSGNQANSQQLQQNIMKVGQLEMARSGGQPHTSGGMIPQQQSMLKHFMQEKEMRRQLLKQQLSSSGVDPLLGEGNANFHPRDANLGGGVGIGGNFGLSHSSDEFLSVQSNLEEMDTGEVVGRSVHNSQQHMMSSANQSHGNSPRFSDFLDSLPSSNVDFGNSGNGGNHGNQNLVQNLPSSAGGLDGGDLMPTLQDTLTQQFDVDSMLNHVKTETVDNGMIWL